MKGPVFSKEHQIHPLQISDVLRTYEAHGSSDISFCIPPNKCVLDCVPHEALGESFCVCSGF